MLTLMHEHTPGGDTAQFSFYFLMFVFFLFVISFIDSIVYEHLLYLSS